ncbi:hypothetical protein P4V39_02645 [Brevibacillus borstelensis]|uniref:hypothetical protein n=1 Tax=Brevibacillus borstelensis TaxID=45462 RepID=UPI002E22B83E|nr:hypothetical protein [Brevibacillus borstelensis]
MNLKVYQIIQSPTQEERWSQIVRFLSKTDFYPGEHSMRYCLNKVFYFEQGLFVGAMHEEYIPDQTEMTEDKEERTIDNIDPWERTIFAIDFPNKKLLIQQRDYSPRNLSRTTARSRIVNILDEAWYDAMGVEFNYIPTNLNLGNEYFIQNFINGRRVLGAKLNFGKTFLVDKLFDGSEPEEAWISTWNDDASGLSELTFSTVSSGDLHNSPFFKLAISTPNVEIESITYFDSVEDKPITESRRKFDLIEVPDVTKRTEVNIALMETFKAMQANQEKLQSLRAIQLD